MRDQVEWLLRISLVEKWGYHCWNGLGISIDMRGDDIDPSIPGLIGTAAVALALAAYCRRTGDPRIPEILRSVRDGLITNHFQEYAGISFFRYKPVTPLWQFTINASAIGAALLCRINELLRETKGLSQAERAISSILDFQEHDGRWKYTVDLKSGRHKEQVDFHQAYILLALLEVQNTMLLPFGIETSVRRGLDYQNSVQLRPTGALYYRYPKKYPYNIHNQLYAFYVNRLAGRLNTTYQEIAEVILNWTLEHLYDPDLGFIYGVYPGFKIRIPYSRWGNAHAVYLFSRLLSNEVDS